MCTKIEPADTGKEFRLEKEYEEDMLRRASWRRVTRADNYTTVTAPAVLDTSKFAVM
jgi:hypothetical protein